MRGEDDDAFAALRSVFDAFPAAHLDHEFGDSFDGAQPDGRCFHHGLSGLRSSGPPQTRIVQARRIQIERDALPVARRASMNDPAEDRAEGVEQRQR